MKPLQLQPNIRLNKRAEFRNHVQECVKRIWEKHPKIQSALDGTVPNAVVLQIHILIRHEVVQYLLAHPEEEHRTIKNLKINTTDKAIRKGKPCALFNTIRSVLTSDGKTWGKDDHIEPIQNIRASSRISHKAAICTLKRGLSYIEELCVTSPEIKESATRLVQELGTHLTHMVEEKQPACWIAIEEKEIDHNININSHTQRFKHIEVDKEDETENEKEDEKDVENEDEKEDEEVDEKEDEKESDHNEYNCGTKSDDDSDSFHSTKESVIEGEDVTKRIERDFELDAENMDKELKSKESDVEVGVGEKENTKGKQSRKAYNKRGQHAHHQLQPSNNFKHTRKRGALPPLSPYERFSSAGLRSSTVLVDKVKLKSLEDLQQASKKKKMK